MDNGVMTVSRDASSAQACLGNGPNDPDMACDVVPSRSGKRPLEGPASAGISLLGITIVIIVAFGG